MKTPQLLSQYLNSLQHLDNKYMAALVPEFLSRKIEFDAVEMRMQSVFMVEFDSDAFIPLIEDSVNSLKEMFLPSIPKLYNAMKASVNADNISTLQFRDSFERLLHETPRELNLKSHYPILYSQIHKCIENFLEFIEFIASSIQQDVKSLALNFGADPQAKIISVKPLDSDPHFGQKKVLNIKFSDGTNLVLKPRSLEIDLAFQNFLRWINSNSNSDDIQQMDLTIVSFQNRGWMPFVAQIPCTSEKDIIQYYRRIGDMMAILYLLVATDMHFENIIAHGAYPIICDLECLLQPFLKQENNSLFDGVEQIGMLPNALWMGREAGDISGISGQGNYKTNWTLPTLEINEQGDLVIEQRPLIVELGKNRPLFKGSSVCPSSYSAQIVDSFQNRYNFFLKMKEALVANTSPLNFFKRTPVRVILRNTSTYRKLYHESWIPSLLRSREKRETYFDWLDADAKNVDLPISVTISEKSDLWNNDIPHFTHIPQDECILDSKGNRIENLVEQGGWERLKNRFNGKMCLADLQRQKWFIKNTLLLLNPINPQLTDFEFVQTEKMEQEILIERLEWLKVAMGKGSTEFVPVQVGRNSNRNPVLQRNFHGVYNGSSGCLLVLVYLDFATFGRTSAWTKSAVEEYLGKCSEHLEIDVLGSEGLGGIIFTLGHLRKFFDDTRIDTLEKVAIRRAFNCFAETDFSIKTGYSGLALALTRDNNFARTKESEKLLAILSKTISLNFAKLVPDQFKSTFNCEEFVTGISGLIYARQRFVLGKISRPPVTRAFFKNIEVFGLRSGMDGRLFEELRLSKFHQMPNLFLMEV